MPMWIFQVWCGEMKGNLWSESAQVQILGPSLTSSVILGNLYYLYASSSSKCEMNSLIVSNYVLQVEVHIKNLVWYMLHSMWLIRAEVIVFMLIIIIVIPVQHHSVFGGEQPEW
jgi:hypothetical protein